MRSFSLPRWVVLLLIPLAYLAGYTHADDERIAELRGLEARQASMNRDVSELRLFVEFVSQLSQLECNGGRHAPRL